MIVSERGYAVKERGIINVKGKGNMRTYFILGRKISRRHGRGSGTTNNNLAEVVYGMVRAKRRRTFRRDKNIDKDQETSEAKSVDSSEKCSKSNPIRRSFRRLNTLKSQKPAGSDSPKSICKTESSSKVSIDEVSVNL